MSAVPDSPPTPLIRPWRDDERPDCERILRSVPEWFGIESALVQYVAETARLPTWLALEGATPVGFVTLRRHFPESAEIHCLAVAAGRHRRGIGGVLVRFVEQHARADGVRYLQVKTLGPARPDPNYELTRRFYAACGFSPLEEFHGLWPGNPCLVLVKSLG